MARPAPTNVPAKSPKTNESGPGRRVVSFMVFALALGNEGQLVDDAAHALGLLRHHSCPGAAGRCEDRALERDDMVVRVDVDVAVLQRVFVDETRAHPRGDPSVCHDLARFADAILGLVPDDFCTVDVNGAKVVGNKTKDGVSKTGEIMTDGWITSRVSARFVNEDTLKNSDINVDTNNHIVTLKGTVPTSAGRARAGVVARQTEGVRRVVNHLTISSK